MSYQKSLLAPVVPIDVLELLPLVHDELESDLAWRLFTKGISTPEAQRRSLVGGDSSLTEQFFQMVSIIA